MICCMYRLQQSAQKIAPRRSRGLSYLAASYCGGQKVVLFSVLQVGGSCQGHCISSYPADSYRHRCLLHSLVSPLGFLRFRLGLGHLEHPSSSVKRLLLAYPMTDITACDAADSFSQKARGGLFLAQQLPLTVKCTTRALA